MHTFQRAWHFKPSRVSLLGRGKSIDTLIRNVAAFHQPNSLQLWECGKLRDGSVSQIGAASEVDVSNAIAKADKLLYSSIRDLCTVSKVDIVQILAELSDGHNGTIRDLAALGKNEVAQPWRRSDNFLHTVIS